MRTLQTYYYIGNRPENIPENWTIWNAPRPICGNEAWDGEWLHGRFYTAIDPDDEFAEKMVTENISLDAWMIEYITIEEAKERVRAEYPDEEDTLNKMPKEDFLSMFAMNYSMME